LSWASFISQQCSQLFHSRHTRTGDDRNARLAFGGNEEIFVVSSLTDWGCSSGSPLHCALSPESPSSPKSVAKKTNKQIGTSNQEFRFFDRGDVHKERGIRDRYQRDWLALSKCDAGMKLSIVVFEGDKLFVEKSETSPLSSRRPARA
jgi:hypothetical protein